MRTAELSRELGIPLKWIEPRRVKKNAMALITVSNSEGEKSVLISPNGLMVVDSDKYVQAPKERIVKRVPLARKITGASVKFIGWGFVSLLLAFSALNAAGIMKARVVLTGSMVPAINPGDVVLTVNPEKMAPSIGDVVVYTGKRFDGSEVASFAHRIIGGNSKVGFTVKGDHNPSEDVQKPKIADITGVVVLTIPLIGKLLNPQIFMLLLVAGFGLWLIVDAFRNEE